MAGMRDIKRRIRSVKNIQKITKAMKMVAAAKLGKAQAAITAARPYSDKLSEVMGRLSSAQSQSGFSHPLLEEKPEGKIGFVVIGADRGLCGGYNQNIHRFAKDKIDAIGEEVSIICVGKKVRDFFLRRNYNVKESYTDLGDFPEYVQGRDLARDIMKMYEAENFKKFYLVYTEFFSPISYKPKMIPLLPVSTEVPDNDQKRAKVQLAKGQETEYTFEPNPEEVLGTLLPRYVETNIYRALLDAKASELGAKMTAMGSATDNAGELAGKLSLSYNRARQAAITKEISEIVGGAAALQ